MDSIEQIILRTLLYNDEISRQILPYLKEEYFSTKEDKILFQYVKQFIIKYNTLPTNETIGVSLKDNIASDTWEKLSDSLKYYEKEKDQPIDLNWFLEKTEEFCQEKAIYNAILQSIEILEKKNLKLDKGIIPTLLSDAIGTSFDTHVGHDYFEDASDRYDFYHTAEDKIPFDLDYLNQITNGGISRKTLDLVEGGTNVGKSLFMCHLAASYLTRGLNVLYITLEMAEEWIAKRIDANQFNIPLNDIESIPKDVYLAKIERLHKKTIGKLIVKEFPTTGASVIHFRHLLNELKMKKKFVPDIIFVDYLTICASVRIKNASDLYVYGKCIAEELRGLAVETNTVVWSGTQLNREGHKSSDPNMTNTAESFGINMTADFKIVLITSDDLEQLNQIMIKQQKNRYNSAVLHKRGLIGIDRSTMRLYDVENQIDSMGQETNGNQVFNDTPIMDKNDKFKDFRF